MKASGPIKRSVIMAVPFPIPAIACKQCKSITVDAAARQQWPYW
jgi:hypothetical protein